MIFDWPLLLLAAFSANEAIADSDAVTDAARDDLAKTLVVHADMGALLTIAKDAK